MVSRRRRAASRSLHRSLSESRLPHKPGNGAIRWLYFQYLRWLVPVFGKLFCGDSDTHGYILDSLLKYPGQRGIDARLRARGCVDPRVVDLMFGAMSLNVAVKAR